LDSRLVVLAVARLVDNAPVIDDVLEHFQCGEAYGRWSRFIGTCRGREHLLCIVQPSAVPRSALKAIAGAQNPAEASPFLECEIEVRLSTPELPDACSNGSDYGGPSLTWLVGLYESVDKVKVGAFDPREFDRLPWSQLVSTTAVEEFIQSGPRAG
jgi:hypothetical protein